MAPNSGASRTHSLKRVASDTALQPKNIAFPTVAKLLFAAISWLNR
jgi:hypothetical protein